MDELSMIMKITELEGQLRNLRTSVSRAINAFEQIQIALEENEDIEEALRVAKEMTGQ